VPSIHGIAVMQGAAVGRAMVGLAVQLGLGGV